VQTERDSSIVRKAVERAAKTTDHLLKSEWMPVSRKH
jgi:hypothetical protein